MISSVALQKYQGTEQQADISMFAFAAPSQPDWPALNTVDFFSFHPWKIEKRPVRAQRGRHHSSGMTVQAVLASFAAILMLISVCGFARRASEYTRSLTRELAGDESTPPGGPDICRYTPEEPSSLSSDEKMPSLAPSEVLESSANMQKLVPEDGVCDQAAAKPSKLAPPPEQKHELPAKRKAFSAQPGQPYQPGPHLPVQQVERAQAEPEAPGPSESAGQEPPSSGSHEGTGLIPQDAFHSFAGGERSSAEMVAALGLLLLQQTAAIGGPPTGEIVHQGEELPQPSTSRAEPLQLVGPSTAATQLQPAGPAAEAAVADQDLYVPGLYPPSLVPPGSHPFFNLPALHPGVVPRTLNLNRACSYGIAAPSAHSLLNQARAVFVKDSLSQDDADTLVDLLERIISHCYYHQQGAVVTRRYIRVCDTLAIRFLLFDAIVSGFMVLRQFPSRLWWQGFVKVIPHRFTGRTERRYRGPQSSRHELLASALSKALETLKTGVRPSRSTLFKLKYMLFCSARATERLQVAEYEPWRNDCPDNSGGIQRGFKAE